MFEIEFELTDSYMEEPISGFELGHITIRGESGEISSKGRKPDQSIMIFVSLVDLMDNFQSFLDGSDLKYKFEGADSSFAVYFEKQNENLLISSSTPFVVSVSQDEFIKKLFERVKVFIDHTQGLFEADNPVFIDLKNAFSDFKKFVEIHN